MLTANCARIVHAKHPVFASPDSLTFKEVAKILKQTPATIKCNYDRAISQCRKIHENGKLNLKLLPDGALKSEIF